MIDTIKPMGLDLSKDLHGHVRVELRDRWTGRVVDSQEKNNLVTNAVQKMLMAAGWASGTPSAAVSSAWLPIHEKVLGGVMLFDGTLTESASNISFPSSVKLVGYAARDSASDALHGSYNPQESVVTSNGFTTVWDFTTAQANGTIASLARTSRKIVNIARDSTFTATIARSSTDTFSSFSILGYDDANEYLYITPSASQTIGGVTYSPSSIYRCKFSFTKFTLWGTLPPASKLTLVKTLTSSDGTTSAGNYAYDKFDNNFVTIIDNTIHLIAMDGTHTTKSTAGTSGNMLAVTENYYWRSSFNDTFVYRISKSAPADVYEYTTTYWTSITPSDTDVCFAFGTNPGTAANILYPDNTNISVIIPSMGSDYTGRRVGPFTMTSSGGLNPICNYLGTIANLDSPVTKSSSQTMKIIYTLTEA